MERMRQMSSIDLRIQGNRSLTWVPHFDSRLNSQNCGSHGLPLGAFLPSFAAAIRAGLGSNVSICDAPPLASMKITRLALGVKCGALGARSSPESARHCRRMAGSSAEPLTIERIICRRVGSKLENFDRMVLNPQRGIHRWRAARADSWRAPPWVDVPPAGR